MDYKLILEKHSNGCTDIRADGRVIGVAIRGGFLDCFGTSHVVESMNHAQRIVAHELYLRTGQKWELADP